MQVIQDDIRRRNKTASKWQLLGEGSVQIGRNEEESKTSSNTNPSLPLATITEVQYENIEELMTEFCKVPLLDDFVEPVGKRYPEVSYFASF